MKGFNYCHCFFGTHLLPRFPEATCVFVESEKTAIVLAHYLRQRGLMGQYLPIATGGSANVRFCKDFIFDDTYKWLPFRGRNVVFVPDCDMTETWTKDVGDIGLRNLLGTVEVYDLSSHGASGSMDIADLLERNAINN